MRTCTVDAKSARTTLGQKASCRVFQVDQCGTRSGLSYGRGGKGGSEGFFMVGSVSQ